MRSLTSSPCCIPAGAAGLARCAHAGLVQGLAAALLRSMHDGANCAPPAGGASGARRPALGSAGAVAPACIHNVAAQRQGCAAHAALLKAAAAAAELGVGRCRRRAHVRTHGLVTPAPHRLRACFALLPGSLAAPPPEALDFLAPVACMCHEYV